MDPALLATIVDAARDLMIDRYANTAGAAVWFYDYLLTFSAEYKYIWKKKWNLVKILYLLLFVIGAHSWPTEQIFDAPFSNTRPLPCIFYDITVTILRAIQLLVSTWLILIVVRSLSLNNRGFKYFIYLVFLAMNIVAAGFAVLTLKDMYRKSTCFFPDEAAAFLIFLTTTIKFIAAFNVCDSNSPDSTRWLYLSQVPFDVLLLAIELCYYWRLHRLISPAQPTRLLATMYLDGVWYFAATITVKLTAGLVIIFATPTYWYIATSADQAFTSTFIARLVLHLHSVTSPSSATTYTNASTSYTSLGPKITDVVTGKHNLGVQWLELQHGHDDDESELGEHY